MDIPPDTLAKGGVVKCLCLCVFACTCVYVYVCEHMRKGCGWVCNHTCVFNFKIKCILT